jgi:hypothetical protein
VGYRRDEWFLKNNAENQVPCLDEITLFGYMTLAIQALHGRIAALEGKVQ